MPQQPLTFGDGVQKIVGILAQMELDPQADDQLISELRGSILSFARSAGGGAQTPDMGPSAVPGTPSFGSPDLGGGMPLPVPVTEGDLSRGPTPNPDLSGAVAELSRMSNGA